MREDGWLAGAPPGPAPGADSPSRGEAVSPWRARDFCGRAMLGGGQRARLTTRGVATVAAAVDAGSCDLGSAHGTVAA